MLSRNVQVARYMSLSLEVKLMGIVKVSGHNHLIDENFNGDGM